MKLALTALFITAWVFPAEAALQAQTAQTHTQVTDLSKFNSELSPLRTAKGDGPNHATFEVRKVSYRAYNEQQTMVAKPGDNYMTKNVRTPGKAHFQPLEALEKGESGKRVFVRNPKTGEVSVYLRENFLFPLIKPLSTQPLPCTFVRGDWNALIAGDPVEINLTHEGVNRYLTEMKSYLRRQVEIEVMVLIQQGGSNDERVPRFQKIDNGLGSSVRAIPEVGGPAGVLPFSFTREKRDGTLREHRTSISTSRWMQIGQNY